LGSTQSLACMRELGLKDDDERVNPNGGAIALGHPLGMKPKIGLRMLHSAQSHPSDLALNLFALKFSVQPEQEMTVLRVC
jgi:hypothetical protein